MGTRDIGQDQLELVWNGTTDKWIVWIPGL